MPVIWYTEYIPVSASPREVSEKEHLLGRSLLIEGLRKSRGLSLTSEDIAVDERGKPFLTGHPGIHFNISHCDGLVICAADEFPVGADAEKTGYFADILLKKALSREERLFFEGAAPDRSARREWFYRFWTLKEAYVKRSGTGVDVDLTAFSFSFDPEARMTAEGSFSSVRCSDPSVSCFQTLLPSGHIVSLCCTGKRAAPSLIRLSPDMESSRS